ncbi:MAG: helix-turn-helix transcriptional regulator [Rikenellaceae bacterium]|nr:helix-turn-helix transcriptional regulator [Rikenellaceae bacterium]
MNEQQLFLAIGERIRSVRMQKNMNQQDLAARCNFEKSNMSRIEAGRTNLTVRSLDRIARALDVKIRDLVDVE